MFVLGGSAWLWFYDHPEAWSDIKLWILSSLQCPLALFPPIHTKKNLLKKKLCFHKISQKKKPLISFFVALHWLSIAFFILKWGTPGFKSETSGGLIMAPIQFEAVDCDFLVSIVKSALLLRKFWPLDWAAETYASLLHNILEMHASLKCHWFSTKVKMPSFNAFLRELQRRLERVWTKSLLIAHHKIWIYIFLMQKFFTAPKSKCCSKIISNFINGKTLFCSRLSNSFALFNKPLYLLWGDCWLLCQQDQWYSIFDFGFICCFLPFDDENKRLAFPLLSKKFLSPLTSLVVRVFYVKHSACLLDYLLLFTEPRAG